MTEKLTHSIIPSRGFWAPRNRFFNVLDAYVEWTGCCTTQNISQSAFSVLVEEREMKQGSLRWFARVGVALVGIPLVMASPAYAIRVVDLATGGYITPGWFVAPTSPAGDTLITQDPGNVTNFEIKVGVSNFGAKESDQQPSAIYGAGALLPANGGKGYRVEFNTTLYGWDSYDVSGYPAPGNTGYWDSFAVNLNPTDYYWNLVNGGGVGAIADPIVTPDPAGSCVGSPGVATISGPVCAAGASNLPGETWAWGALDYGNGTFEGNIGNYTLTFTGVTGLSYLSVTLDTATTPEADTNYPSFGAFNPLGPVPEPETVPLPGTILLFGSGVIGLGLWRYSASKRKQS